MAQYRNSSTGAFHRTPATFSAVAPDASDAAYERKDRFPKKPIQRRKAATIVSDRPSTFGQIIGGRR